MNIVARICLVSVAILSITSCDNINNSVGYEVLPDYLKSNPISKDYEIGMRTVEAGTSNHKQSIYVSSSLGYLGRIPNAVYGGIESEYLTQFYIPSGFKFKDQDIIQRIDSVHLVLHYNGFVGDSIANMQVEARRLKKSLEHSKYSISDVSEYLGETIGKQSFWAGRGTDRVLNKENKIVSYKLAIPLSRELGQEFFDKSKSGDPVFSSQQAFDDWFKGVYIHTTAGQGSVLRVISTELVFYYDKEFEVTERTTDKKSGKTTDKKVKKILPTSQSLIHTSEVPQLSRFINYGLSDLINNHQAAFVKAPNGLWTELTIPTTEIVKDLKEVKEGYTRVLNSATFQLQGENPEESSISNPFYLDAPKTLLMLPKDRVEDFFANERTENSPQEVYTSYIGEIAIAGSRSYNFGNIGSLIIDHIDKHPDKDLVVVLIPVERVTNNHDRMGNTRSISHLVLPTAVKFVINKQNTKLQIAIIERKSGAPF